MTKKVITTVGTSLFSNYMKEDTRKQLEKKEGYKSIDSIFRQLEDAESGADTSELKKITKKYWLDVFRPNASAEITSLLKIAEQEELEVYLLATETALSVAACELIKEYLGSDNNIKKERFKSIHFDKNEHVIKGLQVKDAKKFQDEGFINLVEKIVRIRNSFFKTVLNISGGYKALIPPLTLMAQLEKIPLFYIYEDSEVPIETGVLPINFDWGFIENFVILLNNDNKRNNATDVDIEAMRERKLVQTNSRDLTILGQLIKRYSNSASPFTSTIFGYFIEHKLYECFANEYGAEKVEHSVKYNGMGTEDIDLLITPNREGIIPVEIKPSDVLSNEPKMNDIAEKLINRTSIAIEKGQRTYPSEVWLITYSYSEQNGLNKSLTEEETKIVSDVSKLIINSFSSKPTFRVKHLFIVQNKLKSERHIYQSFMKETIKINQIEDIFDSSKF